MARGTAIVVTYNSSLWVERCLEALLSQPGWEVVVIDNASQDDTPARAARFASQARVVCNTDNKGFA
jgi:glycosyltransferase involved in cell wall biosynthesis